MEQQRKHITETRRRRRSQEDACSSDRFAEGRRGASSSRDKPGRRVRQLNPKRAQHVACANDERSNWSVCGVWLLAAATESGVRHRSSAATPPANEQASKAPRGIRKTRHWLALMPTTRGAAASSAGLQAARTPHCAMTREGIDRAEQYARNIRSSRCGSYVPYVVDSASGVSQHVGASVSCATRPALAYSS